MSNEIVTVRNLITGKVGKVRKRIAEHAIFGLHLEVVPDGTKSRIPLTEIVEKKASQKPRPPKPSDEKESE